MNHSHIITKCKRGFTLIEVMVVMLLISIVLAVVVPRFEGGPLQDPMKKFSRWMINTVRELRSAAIQKQETQTLVVDISNQRMWITRESMSEEELEAAAEKAFSLYGAIKIVNVKFPGEDAVSTETVGINFYPAGYSDRAVIRLQGDDAERLSFLLEPLLPKLKVFEEWIEL